MTSALTFYLHFVNQASRNVYLCDGAFSFRLNNYIDMEGVYVSHNARQVKFI